MFSSSKKKRDGYAHQGSSHYKKKGFLEKIISIIGSSKSSNKQRGYNPHRSFSSSDSGYGRSHRRKRNSSWS